MLALYVVVTPKKLQNDRMYTFATTKNKDVGAKLFFLAHNDVLSVADGDRRHLEIPLDRYSSIPESWSVKPIIVTCFCHNSYCYLSSDTVGYSTILAWSSCENC